ncbi:uncharacterized protein LOC126783875 isoform X2 [Argentina anserina]|uniref:uncharacterized protein LOC126783875 isoform X2 n=1 Tax=Argentina anserina TaxID=57926 RepID=UPI002176910E|nr:uncharacterized protein LOC126783875 isoform X2 [Potentilla anserina]XP_050365419.1 uncharacterized protein LOC126783875 isoform X2 [Potentilla anserina]
MAKLIFTVAVLFLLFAFSHARTPSDLPNGLDVADDKIPVTDADVKEATNTLRLPSERPESGTVMDLEPETIIIAAEQPKFPESEFSTTILSNDENTISFRPVGRHFSLSFRHGHRCRHNQGKWTLRFHGAEREKDDTNTSYGDDMILSSGDELKFDHHPFGGGVRQISAGWGNIRHDVPRFPFKHEDDDNNVESERPRRRHRHHDHEFDMEMVGEEQHREHKHEHGHSLFKSFRTRRRLRCLNSFQLKKVASRASLPNFEVGSD